MLLKNKKLLFLVSLGSVLEYYDFAIFIYLAKAIGESLIPVQNPQLNLILSFAIFAIGAFFRPLGGIIFSHFGDTRGRNKTFIYTILFMAVPTLLMAFIPNASLIGVWSTVALIILRILQGLAIGGEVPGSIVFGYEVASREQKPISTAIVIVGTNIGFILASAICVVLINTKFDFAIWRIAFVLGGLFGIISYFLRKQLSETAAFNDYQKLITKETVPLKLLLTNHKKATLQMVGLGSFLASILAMFTFYMPTYLSTFYHFPLIKLMEFNSYSIFIFIVASLFAGIFHRYFGKRFFIFASLILGLLPLWLFPNYANLSLNAILYIHFIILVVLGIVCGRLPVIIASFFKVSVRYTGVAFAYNISFGIVAGSTQMILSWLIKVTGLLWVPAIYLAIFALIALATMCSIKSRQFTEYQE